MSLFDLRDVCMVIGSLATLDLPMVVDLIGIYVFKGPYCTLTMTDWFLQALSVIPRGSWGDVARRFTMIRWASPKMWFRSHTCCGPTASCIPEPLRVTQGPNCYFGLGGPKNCFRIIILSFVNCVDRSDLIVDRDYDGATVMDLKRMFTLGLGPTQAHWTGSSPLSSIYMLALGLQKTHNIQLQNPRASRLPPSPLLSASTPLRRRPSPCAAACHRRRTCSDRLDEEIPSVKYSSRFLVQTDEGIVILVVDRIRRTTTAYR
ncbi:hypothetical protein F511_21900 [Dorcoceras hygrometricum]|uniref:Uncharacterized protein n=1 Tax=Dorcoceras hygrometricum TaxID=472368 RepID=A0A2Z7BKQ5_9LAMI|nr:hypothetical protein F511_21900 [Dorcoceras hygrometricum]